MTRAFLAALALFPFSVLAADDAELRAAAERYQAVAGIERMLGDTYQSLAARLPEDKKAEFIELMNELVDSQALRDHSLDQLREFFTTEELNAMADFYGTEIGQSVLGKFGAYNAQVTPKVMQDVLNAAEEARVEMETGG